MTINTEKIRSPQMIFIIYMLVSCFIIMLLRFIFPDVKEPIQFFARDWRLLRGALELFNWYPALVLSALVIPFGIVTREENFQSFSEVFFKRLIVSVVIAICATAVYAVIFFLALPMVKNSEEKMRVNGEFYNLSKVLARERGDEGEWLEASRFLAICDVIWPNSPELTEFRTEIGINLERARMSESMERNLARSALTRDWRGSRSADMSVLSGDQQPVSAAQAVSMGRSAMNEKRYFDAHWLFTLGGRLAVSGGPEAANAARLASDAWNMISSQAPNIREENLHRLFNLKLSGYQAMNTGEWIRAFYIFQELLDYTPDDPDAKNFLAASERGAKETAFFIDEMELSIGEIQTGALFSLPSGGGRAVLRFSSLTTSDDKAYGTGFEFLLFDASSRPASSVRSRYAKLAPFVLNGKPNVLILTHAIDRDDEKNSYDSEWLIGNKSTGGILLDIGFEDLMLLSEIQQGLGNLQITELFEAANKLYNAGHVYQVFQAEILNRVGSTIFFLPVAILVIVTGWRFRVNKRPRYLFILMLVIMPVVFLGLVYLYRLIFNTLGIWLVLNMGFSLALIIYIVTMALFSLFSLIVLSAQRA